MLLLHAERLCASTRGCRFTTHPTPPHLRRFTFHWTFQLDKFRLSADDMYGLPLRDGWRLPRLLHPTLDLLPYL